MFASDAKRETPLLSEDGMILIVGALLVKLG